MRWTIVAVLLAIGWVALLVDAVGDVPEAGLFAGLLRVTVEAVAAVVTIAAAWRRRRERTSTSPAGTS